MSDLKVSLVLQLKNLLGRGIGQARGDLKGLKDEAKGLAGIKGPNAAGLAQYGKSARDASQALRHLKREQTALGAGRAAGNTILAGTGRAALALGGIYGVGRVATAAVREAITFEQAMAQVKKKVDGADDPAVFGAIERDVKRMAQAYGIAQVEMAKLVAEAGASGIAVRDLSQFMNLAAKASVGWDMSAQETAQVLAQIKAGSQMSTSEVSDLADMINYLGDSSAAKERDIVDMFQRAGEAAKAAGSDTKTTLAFLTGARAMGIGTEIGARFFGALTSKLTNVSKKGKEALKGLGLSEDNIKRGMEKNPFQTMTTVLEKLKTSARRAEFAKDLFGAEWFDDALRLSGGINEVKKAYQGLQNSSNWRGSLDKGLKIELATTANHMARLSALAKDVQDSLARWTLPPINTSIEKLLDLVDRLRGKTKSGTEKEASDQEMKRVSDYETAAQLKSQEATDARASAKTTKNKKDKETLLQRAERAEREANELRERAAASREAAQFGARTAQGDRNENNVEAEHEAVRKRLRQIGANMTEEGEFRSPAQKAEHDELVKRRKELDAAAKAKQEGEKKAVEELRQQKRQENKDASAGQKRQGLERLQGILSQAAPGQDFVRDAKTGANWNVEKLKQEIQRLQQQLGELGPEAQKNGAAVKDALTLDLTSQGATSALSWAAGLRSGIPAVMAAAAELRAPIMTPAASIPGASGGRPATGGGATSPARGSNVQVTMNVTGSGDAEKTARLVERRLAAAIQSSLSGAHHDGVT